MKGGREGGGGGGGVTVCSGVMSPRGRRGHTSTVRRIPHVIGEFSCK